MTNALTSKVNPPKILTNLRRCSAKFVHLLQDRERTFNEVNIIRKCCHVNIIRYKVSSMYTVLLLNVVRQIN